MALPPYPSFMWSRQKSVDLQVCLRRLYYTTLAHWNGWRSDAPVEQRSAYTLKKVTTLPALIGTLIHDAIDQAVPALAKGEQPHEHYISSIESGFRKAWDQSISEGWRRNAKWNVNLFEHLYGLEPHFEESFDRCRELARVSWNNLLGDVGLPKRLGEWQSWYSEGQLQSKGILSFMVEDARVFAAPDFIGVGSDGHVDVLDWKSGKPGSTYKEQMVSYAALVRFGDLAQVAPDVAKDAPIAAELVYIGHVSEIQRSEVSDEMIDSFTAKISADLVDMRKLMQTVEHQGETLVKARSRDDFAPCLDASECSRCSFLYMCREELGLADNTAAKAFVKEHTSV